MMPVSQWSLWGYCKTWYMLAFYIVKEYEGELHPI